MVSLAIEVTLELPKLNWELFDLTYRFEWDDPEWLQGKPGEPREKKQERLKIIEVWGKRKTQLLESIARRIKYEALNGKVVATGHIGKIPYRSVYDMEPEAGLDIGFEVLETSPDGEVRIGEETFLKVLESSRHW